MDSRGTIPIQGHKGPCQRTSKNSKVCEDRWARVPRELRRVAEVCHCQLDEVDDDQQQGPPEVRSAPEVNEAKKEEVVADKPWCQVQSCCQRYGSIVGLEEAGEVWDLEDVEDAVYGFSDGVTVSRRQQAYTQYMETMILFNANGVWWLCHVRHGTTLG